MVILFSRWWLPYLRKILDPADGEVQAETERWARVCMKLKTKWCHLASWSELRVRSVSLTQSPVAQMITEHRVPKSPSLSSSPSPHHACLSETEWYHLAQSVAAQMIMEHTVPKTTSQPSSWSLHNTYHNNPGGETGRKPKLKKELRKQQMTMVTNCELKS